jgi:predicted dehydrogenase
MGDRPGENGEPVMRKVRWGVLGAADIAVKKVIPAMRRSACCEIVAIASREFRKAEQWARRLDIPNACGSYDELLGHPDIEAVYNPLPNHLHVPWTIRCAEAGKHVLCEKPIALDARQARQLLAVEARTGVKIGEAFMVRTHPQWQRTRELIRTGQIGELRSILGFFSYFNRDPANIRNMREWGGGGLLDIGCYPIHTSRFIFGEEPRRVIARIEYDQEWHVDRLTSALLDFPSGQSVFTCATQLVPYQRMQFFGSSGRLEIEIPFNAPPDRPCRIFVDDGSDLFGAGIRTETFPVCDQYAIQGDAFSRAVRGEGEVPVPVEDAVRNMEVIDALVRSVESGRWERPGAG